MDGVANYGGGGQADDDTGDGRDKLARTVMVFFAEELGDGVFEEPDRGGYEADEKPELCQNPKEEKVGQGRVSFLDLAGLKCDFL